MNKASLSGSVFLLLNGLSIHGLAQQAPNDLPGTHFEVASVKPHTLTSPKGSTKLVKSQEDTGALRAILHGIAGTGVSMKELARGLSDLTGSVVIDQTCLTDRYDIHLECSTARPGSNAPGESILDDLREQLGLNPNPENPGSMCL